MNIKKLLPFVIPLCLILLDIFWGFSSAIGDRRVVLSLFMAFWMVIYWVLELLPLGITALIPLFYLPLLNIISVKTVSPSYAHPAIFLFVGGFIIARALEKTKLSERIAIFALLKTGKSDSGIIYGFIGATAFLSMWISNTATTVMMVPIGLSVIQFLDNNIDGKAKDSIPSFSVALFLSIAYAANIGGIVTPIGTPPNVVFTGYLDDLYNRHIDFYKWMLMTLPIAILILGTMAVMLKRFFPYSISMPESFKEFVKKRYMDLGPIGSSQRVTIFIFGLAVFLWIFKDLIHWFCGFTFINDTSVAIFAGVLLFVIPSTENQHQPVLDKSDITKLPWDIVLLFGGGLALATALREVGIIESVTQYFAGLNLANPFVLILLFSALALFLTEIMSNLALCVVALPLIMKIAESQGIDPIVLAVPATLCASFAFSLPISTPPNAIVFGTNRISVKQMMRAGIPLNFVALAITVIVSYLMLGR